MAHPCSLRWTVRALLIAGAAAGTLALGIDAVPAQPAPPAASGQSCPAGYQLIDVTPPYCVNSAGDVVEPVAR